MASDSIPLSIAAWLLTYTLHSTVLIGGAWLAAAGLARVAGRSQRGRDRLPVLRERLWKIALVGGLVTASLQTGLGLNAWGTRFALASESSLARSSNPPVATLEASTTTSNAVALLAVTAAPTVTTDDSPSAGTAVVTRSDPTQGAKTSTALPRAASGALSRVEPVTRGAASNEVRPQTGPNGSAPSPVGEVSAVTSGSLSSSDWVRIVLCVWIVGVAYGLGRWLYRWHRLLQSLDGREPVVSGELHRIFQQLHLRSGARAGTTLSTAPGIAVPMTLGIRRLEICLPIRAALDLQPDEIEALLAHELAHAERRDPMWLSLCRLLEVVLFFQPLNRVCSTWLEDEAEYLCDDWAIVQIGERIALASCLTEIAGWIVHERRPSLASGMAARGTRLTTRVRRLLDESHAPSASSNSGWMTTLASAGALGVALLVPGVSATPESMQRHDPLSMRMETLEASFAGRGDTGASSSAVEHSRRGMPRSNAHSGGPVADLFARVVNDFVQSVMTVWHEAGSNTEPLSCSNLAEDGALAGPLTRNSLVRGDLATVLEELDHQLESLRGTVAERGTTDEIEEHLGRLEVELVDLHERAAQLTMLLQDSLESTSRPLLWPAATGTFTNQPNTKD